MVMPMRITIVALVLALSGGLATRASGTPAPKRSARAVSELEMMTWPEVYRAIHEQGKTVALVYNGGTEQRGPQNVNGGHTMIARVIVRRIAERLGNAVVAPVLPFSVNNATPAHPGTIGLTGSTFALINEEIAEQLIKNGFRTVVLMGDHGGGQKELKVVAEKLDRRYQPEGIRVFFAGDVYAKALADFNEWLRVRGYPASVHAGIQDTSEMLHLGGDTGWVRKELIPTAIGDPVLPRDAQPDPSQKRIDNGILGDARRSTPALGKRFVDMKVDYAVAEIRRLMAGQAPTASR